MLEKLNRIPKPLLYSWINFTSKLAISLFFLFFVTRNFDKPLINFWLIINSTSLITLSIQNGFIITFTRYLVYSLSGRKIDTFNNIHQSFDSSLAGERDYEEFSNLLKTLQHVFKGLGIIYLVISVTAGSAVLAKPISDISGDNYGWLIWSIIVITNTIFVTFNIYQIFLEGQNKISLVQKTLAKTNVIALVLVLTATYFSKSFLVVILVQQAILLLNIFFLRREAKKEDIALFRMIKTGKYKPEILKVVWQQAWKNGYTVIVGSIVKYSSGIIIANLLPVATASVFLLTKRFFEIIDSLLISTMNVFLPKLASMRVKESLSMVMPYIQKITFLIFSLYLLAYVSFLFLGEPILTLMSSNVQLSSKELIILFSFSHFFGRWGAVIGNIGHQSNLVLDHIAVTVYSAIYFLFSLLAFEYLNEGVFPVAMILGIFVASGITFGRIYKSYETNFWQFEKNKLLLFSLVLVLINAIYYFVA